ncbi:unnamed protein product [Diplocarpon coronariae]
MRCSTYQNPLTSIHPVRELNSNY